MDASLKATRPFTFTLPATSSRLGRLEALRGAAAAYVVLGHIGNGWYGSPLMGLPVRFGLEAVILFFLISGFVI